jgi:YbbR domain-containing protein
MQMIRMRRLLDNIEIKLICLLLAVIMWLSASNKTDIVSKARSFISRSGQGAINLLDVPVELIGIKDTVKFIADPSRISMEIICNSGANIDITNLKAKVKLTSKDKDKVSLKESNVELPDGLIFIKSEPTELNIHQKR